MRIANYLRPDCVALRQRADSLTGAVQQMVTLLNGTDNLTDTAVFAADVRARLALGGVCVGNGLAIPHAKSTAVRQLQLAALTLDPPLPCDTPDGKPLDLLVMIAAPAEANDLHVQVLAELAWAVENLLNRVLACLVSGIVLGVPALVLLMQHWPGVFEAGMRLATMASVPSIAGFFIITGCVLVVCSIPGPWIVAGVFLWLKRNEGQTITEMADQLRGDIAGHSAAGRKGGAE